MPEIIKNLLLYKNYRFFASFPSIVLLNGTQNNEPQLLLLFRRARDSRWLLDEDNETHQKLKHLVDHIDSRSQITGIFFDCQLTPLTEAIPLSANPEAADQDANLLLLRNGSLLLSSFSWYPVHAQLAEALKGTGTRLYGHPDITGCHYLMWGGFTRLSHDQGKSWTEHNYLPQPPGAKALIPDKRDYHGGPVRGQAIEVGNEILLPVYGTLNEDKVSSTYLYVSSDQGQHWSFRSVIARDPEQKLSFTEPALLHIKDKTIMAFIRNTSGNDHFITALSTDSGQSWSQWQESSLTGHPVHPLKLSDGRIFLSYGYRHKPYGIRAHLMDSKAEHLLGDEIIIRDDGLCGDVGYPWAVELPNGNVLVVYYFTQEDGVRHIAGSIVEL